MTESSLRERKKIATARDLALAAFELALEHGLGEATVEDVAERAGYSRRTFANHFSCKQEAVVEGFFLRIGMPTDRFGVEPSGDLVPGSIDGIIDAAAEGLATVFTGPAAALVVDFGRLVEREVTLGPFVHQTVFEVRRVHRDRLVAAGLSQRRAALLLGALLAVGGVVMEELMTGNASPDDVAALLTEGLDHVRRGFSEPPPPSTVPAASSSRPAE